MIEAMVGSVGHLNPLFETDDNDRDIDSLVYQGLVGVDARQRPIPVLASSWVESADQLSYTFTIRSGVRWADGVAFSADDVMFTFGVLQNPAYTDPSAQYWKNVTVTRVAPDQVRFTLKAPLASFPLTLRQGIIPEHLFSSVPVTAMASDLHSNAAAIGTGPFRVASISPDRRTVRLVRNPRARPAPYLDSFVMNGYPSLADAVSAVSRGAADAVGALQPPQLASLAKRPDLQIFERQSFSFAAILLNLTPANQNYFTPTSVRLALAESIDRGAIVNSVLGGHADPAPGPIPPSSWAYNSKVSGANPFDLTRARADFAAAGWSVNPSTGLLQKAGQVLSLSLVTADGYPYLQVADAVAQQLKRVGVEVKVEPVAASDLVSVYLQPKDYQLALAAFDNGPDPDQYSLWHSGAPAGSVNFASALNPDQDLIDKDLEDGRASPWNDRPNREAAYVDFQSLMSASAPAVFLFEPHYIYVVSRRIRGVTIDPVVDPSDRFAHVTSWYVSSAG